MAPYRLKLLKIALIVIGILFLSVYPLMQLWPSGWMWQPRQHEYEQMMVGVYGTLGIFLILASRRPQAHGLQRSLQRQDKPQPTQLER